MALVPLRTSSGGHAVGARDLRAFLPTTREELSARGWDALDVLIVTGDAYVDHPAFGPWWDDAHHDLAREALRGAGRADLIGHGPKCLVRPERGRAGGRGRHAARGRRLR
jgi:hypothetical protein